MGGDRLAAALAVGTVLIARQIARPILSIADSARRVSKGDLTARSRVATRDEIGTLAETFNTMTGRLQVLYYDLRQQSTERRRAEEEKEELVAELETKNAELERFTYTVSHDLKSPLVAITGFIGLLERDALAAGTDPGAAERMKKDLKRIRGAAARMSRLLNELLELSRIGRVVNPSEDVPLSELVDEAQGLVEGEIVARGAEVTIDPDLPLVFGDRVRLLEVFQNLLENALKLMGEQEAPRIEIGMRGSPSGAEPVLYVRDNGMGIEPAYLDKVFGLFERLDGQTEGTGVGLALVKRIVEVHGGRIWIESEGNRRGGDLLFHPSWAGNSSGPLKLDALTLEAQHPHRVDSGRPPRRHQIGDQRHRHQHQDGSAEGDGVGARHPVEQAGDRAPGEDCGGEADHQHDRATFIPWPRISRTTSGRFAPIVIRMPISRSRWETL